MDPDRSTPTDGLSLPTFALSQTGKLQYVLQDVAVHLVYSMYPEPLCSHGQASMCVLKGTLSNTSSESMAMTDLTLCIPQSPELYIVVGPDHRLAPSP